MLLGGGKVQGVKRKTKDRQACDPSTSRLVLRLAGRRALAQWKDIPCKSSQLQSLAGKNSYLKPLTASQCQQY